MNSMVKMHGYYWPTRADANVVRYVSHSRDLSVAYKHVCEFHTVVQAGGHCGVWALALAKKFSRVITVEPMDDNFACLLRNTECEPKIEAYQACLGERPSKIKMRFNEKNTGGHKGMMEAGNTPVITIDGLQLDRCDLLVLDIEGMELPALKGAAKTLERFSPVIMLEDRDHGSRFGWGSRYDLMEYLSMQRYEVVDRVSYDIVLKRT